MLKLGQTTTGTAHGVKYLWLVKDMRIYRNCDKKRCYAVMGLKGSGWWTLYNGTLADCRKYIGNETVVEI